MTVIYIIIYITYKTPPLIRLRWYERIIMRKVGRARLYLSISSYRRVGLYGAFATYLPYCELIPGILRRTIKPSLTFTPGGPGSKALNNTDIATHGRDCARPGL